MNLTWKKRFLESAKLKASYSKDPSTKVGAVAVDPVKKIELSSGWNGFPRGIKDSHSRLNDRERKYHLMVHAEMNCIYNATYNGISLASSMLFVYGLPICSRCALGVIQVGITEVLCYVPSSDIIPEKWEKEWEQTKVLFEEAGIIHKMVKTTTTEVLTYHDA